MRELAFDQEDADQRHCTSPVGAEQPWAELSYVPDQDTGGGRRGGGAEEREGKRREGGGK